MNVTQYIRPKSLGEALDALETHGSDALVIAGGTDLIPMLRRTKYADVPVPGCRDRSAAPPAHILVDVGRLDEIKGISQDDGFLRVGGATSIAAIASSRLLKEKAPILAAAARSIGNALVRNRATIGGNLATAAPCADTAPALLALDTVVRLASAGKGEREIALSSFFLDYRSTALRETEIITDILVPIPSERSVGSHEKVGMRRAGSISVVSVAVVMELDGATCLKARIALGAVAPTPVRASAMENALEGRQIDADLARDCAGMVQQHITPIDDIRGSEDYRRWVAEALVARNILKTVGMEDAA